MTDRIEHVELERVIFDDRLHEFCAGSPRTRLIARQAICHVIVTKIRLDGYQYFEHRSIITTRERGLQAHQAGTLAKR